MKKIKLITVAILVVMGINSYAQMDTHSTMAAKKTESFKVNGSCDMCQVRIEKAAKIEGVTDAFWNTDTKILKVTYEPSKVNSDDIRKNIASVGHDTEKFKADDKAYNNLPACCKYEREK
jgi:mercuric ion binding protein